ncbi:hydroxyisourate hydrolase [Rummeliibacillus suwonensis]|jgi:5-hydroxyisourate hydrolase|uniref:hydroxyisourate hydrolase n=1 Tax=Rummeliibacillus suwonensis TaxID=1306154 RepID=UPI0011B6FDA4|nr:hydroxyisourate hydrolase [Rummeliibacillus suwonensis]MBO2537807.1 hydroxyisourate hydrolase [Rummeliibacillus suwonensis]
MTSLSTHVLDLYHGTPARNVQIDIYFNQQFLFTMETDESGRCTPTQPNKLFEKGTYELVFHLDAYFHSKGVPLSACPFLTTIPVRFSIQDDGHYHIPLLVTPWSYQVYRGS